jgi:hypothetical protein
LDTRIDLLYRNWTDESFRFQVKRGASYVSGIDPFFPLVESRDRSVIRGRALTSLPGSKNPTNHSDCSCGKV